MFMKKLFIGLFLCACLFISGCNTAPKWDKADIEAKVMNTYNKRAIDSKLSLRCTKVSLVPDGDSKFTGFAEFNDKTTKPVSITVDPKTGEFIAM